MTTFAQSGDTYDLMLDSDGQLATVSGKEAYANLVSDALRTIRGEYPYDVELGVPYFQTCLGKNFSVVEWISEVQERTLAFPFVKSISSFDYSYDAMTKTMSYRMSIITDLGPLEIEQ